MGVGSRHRPNRGWKPVAASVTRPRMSLLLQRLASLVNGGKPARSGELDDAAILPEQHAARQDQHRFGLSFRHDCKSLFELVRRSNGHELVPNAEASGGGFALPEEALHRLLAIGAGMHERRDPRNGRKGLLQ